MKDVEVERELLKCLMKKEISFKELSDDAKEMYYAFKDLLLIIQEHLGRDDRSKVIDKILFDFNNIEHQ